jgi:dipeptidyl aminopeptidase/acylaminoacyl peptidase
VLKLKSICAAFACAGLFAVALPAQPAVAQATKAATLPTLDQITAFPSISSLTLSPDGKRMAALQVGPDGERIINVWETGDIKKAPIALGRAGNAMKFQLVQFVKDDILLVAATQRYNLPGGVFKAFISKTYVYDLTQREWREIVRQPAANSESEQIGNALASPSLVSRLPKEPDYILVQDQRSNGDGDVLKVNIRTGSEERVERMPERTGSPLADLNGVVRSRVEINTDANGSFAATWFRNPDSGVWEEHFRSYAKQRELVLPTMVSVDGDPGKAFVVTSQGRDKSAIYEYDLRTRKRGAAAFESNLFDITGVARAGDGELLSYTYGGPSERRFYLAGWARSLIDGIHQRFNIGKGQVDWTDPATGTITKIDYPTELSADLVAAADGGKIAVVAIGGPRQPPIYYLVVNGVLTPMGGQFPSYDPNTIGARKWVTYKARDGLDIPAIVSLPNAANFGPGPYPTIVMPHGGPWARDDIDFDTSFWPTFFTMRGMAVLQPQYRGSEGFGQKLWRAGDKEWGQKMQDDKDDGVKWMIAQGMADPKRVAMYGFSYGGYAAFVAAVRPNGLYQCAISGAGVSDLETIFRGSYQNRFNREFQRWTIEGMSPYQQADKIQIPILIFTGDRDNTVPVEQVEKYANNAKRSNVFNRYVLIKDFAHGPAWTRQIWRQHMDEMEKFLKSECRPGGGGL